MNHFHQLLTNLSTNNTQIVKTILTCNSGEQLESQNDSGSYIALAADKNYVLEASIDRNKTSKTGMTLV